MNSQKIHESWEENITDISRKIINITNYRVENSITMIPLWAVNEVQEYTKYAEYIDENYENIMEQLSQNANVIKRPVDKIQWLFSMFPEPRGFSRFPQMFFNEIRQKIGSIETAFPNVISSHHFFRYLELTGKSPLSYSRVVELGGGLGDLSIFFRNMGYNGRYIIYDLPEISKLQKLPLCGYNIELTNEIPNYEENTLFISTWGLSECPLPLREAVLKILRPENWLIIYQREFAEYDNELYFSNWEGSRYDMSYIRWDGGSEMICK